MVPVGAPFFVSVFITKLESPILSLTPPFQSGFLIFKISSPYPMGCGIWSKKAAF